MQAQSCILVRDTNTCKTRIPSETWLHSGGSPEGSTSIATISEKGRYSATRAQVSARILAKPRLFHCISIARLHSRALCEYRAPTESAPNELLQKGLGKAGGALANGSGTTYHLRLPHCNMFCHVVGLPVAIRPRMDNMTWPSGIPFLSCFMLPSLRALQHLV